MPDGLEEIGESVFADCIGIEKIKLPASIKSIGDDLCVRSTVYLEAPSGSYASMWAKENGYMTPNTGTEDTSWLNN